MSWKIKIRNQYIVTDKLTKKLIQKNQMKPCGLEHWPQIKDMRAPNTCPLPPGGYPHYRSKVSLSVLNGKRAKVKTHVKNIFMYGKELDDNSTAWSLQYWLNPNHITGLTLVGKCLPASGSSAGRSQSQRSVLIPQHLWVVGRTRK